jgi:hypothetical protein
LYIPKRKTGILWIYTMTDPCDENKDPVPDQEAVKSPEKTVQKYRSG